MSIKIINCPGCNKAYGVQEKAHTYFPCPVCGSIIQNNIITEQVPPPRHVTYTSQTRIVHDPANWPNDQPDNSKQKTPSIWSEIGVGALFIGIIVCVIAFVVGSIYNHFKKPEVVQSVATTPYYPPAANNITPPPNNNLQEQSSNSTPSSQFELCRVRIVNTLHGTDKTGGYKAVTDTVNRTLTLTYINNPNEYMVLGYEGGGICTLRLYADGEMQAEKTMYRQTDMEHNDKEMIYTSRTTEVQLTIMYN